LFRKRQAAFLSRCLEPHHDDVFGRTELWVASSRHHV
jgi:hypothetical protein